ncbi:MAG: hypothetical protein ABGY41_19910, partial [Candidatus Poribacteria bacterium]
VASQVTVAQGEVSAGRNDAILAISCGCVSHSGVAVLDARTAAGQVPVRPFVQSSCVALVTRRLTLPDPIGRL